MKSKRKVQTYWMHFARSLIRRQAALEKATNNFRDYYEFANDIHTYNTRYATSGQLFVHEVNTETYGENSIKYNSIQIWRFFTKHFSKINLLDISISQLKKLVTEYYLSSYAD